MRTNEFTALEKEILKTMEKIARLSKTFKKSSAEYSDLKSVCILLGEATYYLKEPEREKTRRW